MASKKRAARKPAKRAAKRARARVPIVDSNPYSQPHGSITDMREKLAAHYEEHAKKNAEPQ